MKKQTRDILIGGLLVCAAVVSLRSAFFGGSPKIELGTYQALGAVTAVKEAGKTGAIHVIGFDNIAAARQLLKDGKILCTVDQHADKIAQGGIDCALEMLKTKAPPVDRQTPVELVTAEML